MVLMSDDWLWYCSIYATVRCTIESALLEHKGDQNTVLEIVGLENAWPRAARVENIELA